MSRALLAQILARPERLHGLGLKEWELLIAQSRRTLLMARLARGCAEAGLLAEVPPPARRHLEGARLLCEAHAVGVRWELDFVRRALAEAEVPVVLLKGAAYVAAGLPPAVGRLFGDIDILVPHERLGAVETALRHHGWISRKSDPYDQLYYRKWAHELPPVEHVVRGSVLDVHHTITPPTSRFRVAGATIIAAARPARQDSPFLVLAPVDMVLHSAAHLFQEGEFEHGLRDLLDLVDLLGHFGKDAGFWSTLIDRARELGLGRLLYYAAHQAERLLEAPLPPSFQEALEAFRPPSPLREAMGGLLARALSPMHPSCDGPLTGLARNLLYVRAHHLRMPPHLLVPHLLRKAWMRRRPPAAA